MADTRPPDKVGHSIPIEEWNAFPVREKALQFARYLCDTVKVKEVGVNRGYWVEKFLGLFGLPGGYAWCAAFVSWCLVQAGWTKFKSAGVKKWRDWAEANGCLITDPSELRRGDLAGWVNPNGTGHIFFVTSVEDNGLWKLKTIEGNTNEEGSREGDKVARRSRTWRIGFFGVKIK